MATQAEIEAAARAMFRRNNDRQMTRLEWQGWLDDANAALEAAERARQEPKGCPTPGACSCLPSPPESK